MSFRSNTEVMVDKELTYLTISFIIVPLKLSIIFTRYP